MTKKINPSLIDTFTSIAEKRGLTLEDAFIEAVSMWVYATRKDNED
jgi:hypothetical protein